MNMMKMMQQAQNLKKNMEAAQKELAATDVTGSASNGLVEVTMSCTQEVKSVKINPTAVDAADVETLEDLVLLAVKEAIAKGQKTSQERMSALTGGLNLPAGF